MRAKIVAASLLLGLAGIGLAINRGYITVPDRWNPWAPLKIDQPLDWLTRFKLQRATADPARCTSVLAQAQIRHRPVADRRTGPGCGFENAIRIERTTAEVGTPFVLSCRTAIALALWERHVVQPAALSHFGEPVVRLEHFGSYACRNVYGRSEGTRSRHATADALDVAAFVLRNGRRIAIRQAWEGSDGDARFLRDVHRGACRVFDTVLGPAYNEAHRDHFHVDRGGARVCR